jgi:two-component system, response regulator PdtaR
VAVLRGVVGTLRVLIAGDKDFITARLQGQLEDLGHRVLGVVRDGPAAIESAQRSQPDLIFIDQQLPPWDGIDAARTILTRQSLPIILLIGYPSAGLVRRAQEAGILAYLVWPTDIKALGAAIGAARYRFREIRVLREQLGDLQQALCARPIVERAKRMLMRRLQFDEADAFGYLHRQSRTSGTPIDKLAADLLTTEEWWFKKPDLVGCIDAIVRALRQSAVLGPPRVA